MNIAIDGYAGSGKSVLSKEIARALNFKVFDTGSMYRAIACEWDSRNLGEITKNKIENFVKDLSLSVKFIDGKQHTYVNGTDYTLFLRSEKISMLSVLISPFPAIRELVKKIQRNFASKNDCVMEGRDIGSAVLPHAEVKFFITAPVEVRARRRYNDEVVKQPDLKYEIILENLKKRDFLDETRDMAPLRKCKDSIVIDTGNNTVEESLQECLNFIKKVR